MDGYKRSTLAATAVFLFTYVCFFTDPALSLGANTGLQVSQVVALLSLPVSFVLGLPKRQMLALALLLLPLFTSGFFAVMLGRALSDEIAVKSMVVTTLFLAVLVPVGWMANPAPRESERRLVHIMCGVAAAVVTHAIVGAYQAYWFAQDVFPLRGLYQNPSFQSGILRGDGADTWALYVKRPFGLFPEPSAMSASIGPWLVLIVGMLLYPALQYGTTRRTRMLLSVAAISGVTLIFLAKSGYAIVLVLTLLLVGLPVLRRHALQLYRPRSLIALGLFVLAFVALIFLGFVSLGDRLAIQDNSSWLARAASLFYAIAYLGTSLGNLLLGVGPGQSFLVLQNPTITGLLPPAPSTELSVTAVWSVIGTYVQETGLVGATALVVLLLMVSYAILRSSARLVGFGCLLAWLFGVGVTTSYIPLSPVWLMLGVLVSWDRIFRAPAAPVDASASARISRVHEEAKT